MIHDTLLLMRRVPCLLSLLLIFNFSAPFLLYASPAGKIIKDIEVRGLTRLEEGELIDLLSLNIGERLDREKLKAGIRRAFKKGIFQDIQAVSEEYDDGIRLIYRVREILIVNMIDVRGNQKISRKEVRNNFYYQQGELYRKEYINSARVDLMKFFQRKGYPDAEIEIFVDEDMMNSSVNITVEVEEGQALIVKKIIIPEAMRRLVALNENSVFDRDKADQSIKKIEEHYKKENYFNPLVGPWHFSEGELTIPVYPGLRVEVQFKNNSALSTNKLKGELTFIESGEVTDELVAETSDRIKRLYISRGFYNAEAAAGLVQDEETVRVTFVIFEGEKVLLKDVSFSGITINPESVKKIIPLKEKKPFNANRLDESRDTLRRFYNALGYLQADVLDIRKEFSDDGREINLEYVMSEGTKTIMEKISIEGNVLILTSQILEAIELHEGSPYNSLDIGDARHRLISYYRRYGFLDAVVAVDSRIEGKSAFITFKVTENRRAIVGKIILRGNHRTKAKIIFREFTIEEGDPFNSEEITNIKRHLYKLGIFNEVSIEALDPGNERNGEIVKDMLVTLKEAKAGSVEVTAGYGDYEGFRGSFDIKYRNIGGYDREAGFRTEISEVEKKFIFSFREPWLFNMDDIPLKIFLIRENRRSINIETRDVLYKLDKQSLIVGIEKEIAKGLKAGLDYEYSFTDTKDVEEDVILSKEDTGTLGIGSVSPSLFYDTRDNPFDPLSGSLHGIVVKYASQAFLSETEFIKGNFQSSWFFQLMKPVVFAFSLRGGAAHGFDTKELPLIERFFLGGRSSVRGYKNDALGPKGENGDPTGGNVLALLNWELRFSLKKGFGLVAFVDAGNVWQTFDDVEDELKYTAGAGLRYRTPVGPIRIDYGHKMNKEEGESSGEVHFSFGHAF